eukprot:scaffold24896_cov110-Isochrysis_galbana.AAC.5
MLGFPTEIWSVRVGCWLRFGSGSWQTFQLRLSRSTAKPTALASRFSESRAYVLRGQPKGRTGPATDRTQTPVQLNAPIRNVLISSNARDLSEL